MRVSEQGIEVHVVSRENTGEEAGGDIQEHVFYYDEEVGECIEAFKSRVESITYTPAASAGPLKCYASFDDWMTANNIACVLPAAKFDEFGALSRSEEQFTLIVCD